VRAAAALGPAPRPPEEPRSIFVLRNNDLGDLLVVTPLFEALRRRFPYARIAAGVGSWSRDVLRHNPHVTEILPINAPWFNKYQGRKGPLHRLAYVAGSLEVRELRQRGFEVGIDVLGSVWGSLLLLRAGIPWRLGVCGYAGGHSALHAAVAFNPREHVGRSALRFAELLGASDLPPNRPQLFLTCEEREEGERWWAAAELEGRRRVRLLLGPAGGVVARCWPADRYAALAGEVSRLPGISMLVLAGPREGDLAGRVAAAAPGARTFPEAPGLRQVFALAAACDLAVCNSSMLMHAAAAFGKPVVVLLGEAFPSAMAHQAQWGYPGITRSLGRELPGRPGLATPADALEDIREILAAVR
jgi:ADP-heptose:LPS heptosyltransferase